MLYDCMINLYDTNVYLWMNQDLDLQKKSLITEGHKIHFFKLYLFHSLTIITVFTLNISHNQHFTLITTNHIL